MVARDLLAGVLKRAILHVTEIESGHPRLDGTQFFRLSKPRKSPRLPSLMYCITNRGRTHSFEMRMRYSSRPSQVSACRPAATRPACSAAERLLKGTLKHKNPQSPI
eukprot:scaffold54573_cov51-Phaeocystis_antarctica.AAC.1